MQKNWAGNLTYTATEVAHPSTIDEVRELLASGGPVSVLGTRHCFNDIADTEGILIALDRMPREIEVNQARDAVRVSSALRYGDIAPELEAQGLALANLASLPHISVAGAVATGTHGSGDRIGSLASAVRGLTILTASGEIRQLVRGDAEFDGAVVSLGALGIVLDVTLDVEPTYQVVQHVFDAPQWDAILADFDAVTGAGTSVSIFTAWQRTDAADMLWIKQRTPDQRAGERRARRASGRGTSGR
jgi:xylitol oxidase